MANFARWRPRPPRLIALPGVGAEVAGQLLTTLGDNPDRLHCRGSLRPPVRRRAGPSHQRTDPRPPPNRGGDRAANTALYTLVLGRLRYDPRTRAYAARRTREGLSEPEIIRCLKRYIAERFRLAKAGGHPSIDGIVLAGYPS